MRRSLWPVRVVRARPRLFLSAALGALVAASLAAATDWRTATRLLAGWDVAVAVYLVLVLHMIRGCDARRIRRRAAQEDEGQFTILVLTVAAALSSLAAIFAELRPGAAAAGVHRGAGSIVLAAVTIFLSWAFIHMIFALHYAHEFYDEEAGRGLAFPGGSGEPDYWDFVYFSFVIGMTSQVSDVGVTTKRVRRTVAAHGVVSFVFNAALLALTVNLAATAI